MPFTRTRPRWDLGLSKALQDGLHDGALQGTAFGYGFHPAPGLRLIEKRAGTQANHLLAYSFHCRG